MDGGDNDKSGSKNAGNGSERCDDGKQGGDQQQGGSRDEHGGSDEHGSDNDLRHTHTYRGTCNREGEISDRRKSEGGRE